jgi:predicted nucleic acid-binding protein
MRDIFPAFFRPSDAGYKALWKDAVFAIDANVVLNLYRYSTETRNQLEATLTSLKSRLFIPHQAAKEFLRNRLSVTAGQANEYSKAIDKLNELAATLTDRKKHPYLEEAELPNFNDTVERLRKQLDGQRSSLLNRLSNDEILEFIEKTFSGRTGKPFDEAKLFEIAAEGEKRYELRIPPGFEDVKKDEAGDQFRKYGDLILWKQIILHAKEAGKPTIFVTDDSKEDWWLKQSGRTIGPRTELRDEFITGASQDFWMYTVDKFIEEAARVTNTQVSETVIAEIIEVRQEAQSQRAAFLPRQSRFREISRQQMLDALDLSERWVDENSEGWLAFHHFVLDILGGEGFDHSASYQVLRDLEREGVVETYQRQGAGHARPVKAVRIVRPDDYKNRPLEGLKNMLQQPQNAPDA